MHELPERAMSFLTQVYAALDAGASDLAVLGLRSLFDLTALKLVGDVGTFAEKLRVLVAKGYIGEEDAQSLQVVIDAGSAVAHRGHRLSMEHVHLIRTCIEGLLFQRFVVPKRIRALKRAIPKRPKRKRQFKS
jgi:hypothetical protein